MPDAIQVTGLREFQKALRDMDAGLPRMLRVALNEASDLVVDYASHRIERRTGRAAASLKSRSSQREARVALGGRRAPYAPWLDFGGKGKKPGRPPARPYIASGRYVWKGVAARHDEIIEVMSEALAQLARDAGLEVT